MILRGGGGLCRWGPCTGGGLVQVGGRATGLGMGRRTNLPTPQELESPIPENERLTSPVQSDGVDQELSQFLLSLPRAPRGWGANLEVTRHSTPQRGAASGAN